MTFMHITELGDCLGDESCLDLKPATDVSDSDYDYKPPPSATRMTLMRRIAKGGQATAAERKFPPRISSLVRVEDQQAAWVMRKYSTGDGRLVIKQEKAKSHEYLRAHRADGRLVMSLVAAEEDDDEEEEDDDEEDEEEEEEEERDDSSGNAAVTDTAGEQIGNPMVENGAFPEHFKYDGIGVSPCGVGFGAAAPPPLRV